MLPLVPRNPAACEASARVERKIDARILQLFVLLCTVSVSCHSQTRPFLCREGLGRFSSQFSTGVTVSVAAPKNGGFATRACDATLQWGENVLPVAQGVQEIDIDVMGADLGLRVPVVAFQIKASEPNRLATYEVFSLAKPPHLLRTITGGDEYDAMDMDLHGHNEVWTDDASAADGFENLPLSSWDFLPTVVLEFDHQKLIDVSSKFQSYFDRQVAQVKSQLNPKALSEFRESDGKLSSSSMSTTEHTHMLVSTKIKVLEIVWSYLSSGREQQAWSELADMWPPADLDRIRGAIQDARVRGILHQVDGVRKLGSRGPLKDLAPIFDCNRINHHESYADSPVAALPSLNGAAIPTMAEPGQTETSKALVDRLPESIYIGIPFSASQKTQAPPDSSSEVALNLVIDAAGKVRSAQLANKADHGPIGDIVLSASADWNFIPAFVGSRAVACRMLYGVSPQQ